MQVTSPFRRTPASLSRILFSNPNHSPGRFQLWHSLFDQLTPNQCNTRQFVSPQIVDKIRVQMDSFLDDGSHEASLAVIKTLSNAAPLMATPLREYLAAKVLSLANTNAQSSASITRRGAMAEVLYDALCSLNGCGE